MASLICLLTYYSSLVYLLNRNLFIKVAKCKSYKYEDRVV